MSKNKSWFEAINDRLDKDLNFELSVPKNDFGLSWPSGENSITSEFHNFFSNFDKFGFQDKGDYYEMVTNIGGHKDIKESAVKVELSGKNNDVVTVTYEHSVVTENSNYSHSQNTTVTLPKDADAETISAHFDGDNNVVITVKKKVVKEKKPRTREIPIRHV